MVPLLMLATPVLLLFVYDKNNGVLEYLLSLGMTQRDIYMRYLKAMLLLASVFLVIFVPATLVYGYLCTAQRGCRNPPHPTDRGSLLAGRGLIHGHRDDGVQLAAEDKGGQQPAPGPDNRMARHYAWIPVPFLFTFKAGIYADLVIAAAIGLVVLVFLRSSDKLIKREKFLP